MLSAVHPCVGAVRLAELKEEREALTATYRHQVFALPLPPPPLLILLLLS